MFRNRKLLSMDTVPKEIYENYLETTVKDGIEQYTVKKRLANSKKIPCPDDYRLSCLLASGVSLKNVSPTIDESINDSDVEFINELSNEKEEE